MNAGVEATALDRACALVIEEARLLDAARWDEWLALYAQDGLYWVPLDESQVDPRLEQSIACEDRLLLAVRVARMRHPKAWSLKPMPRTRHVLQVPVFEGIDPADGLYCLRTPFSHVEIRDDRRVSLEGTVRHRIRVSDASALIVCKRIDLVDARSALPAIYLPL
jgi:3-phenylpropionate/cinnamic acid dioxygenase small subunit